MHPHLRTHVKPNRALHHIQDLPFSPIRPTLAPLSPRIRHPEWKSMAEVRLELWCIPTVPEIHKLWMHTRTRSLLRAEIDFRISILQPKEPVKAEAEASPLQFASEIQISINHNLITKKNNLVREREYPNWLKELLPPKTPQSPIPVREKETPLTQSTRIRFPGRKFARTLDGPYRLSAVVSIECTHPSKTTSLSVWDTTFMHPHTRTYLKPNEALHHIQDILFCPNPDFTCAAVTKNPASRMEIHGESGPRAVMDSDRIPEIHKLSIHARTRPLLRAEISSRISIPRPKETVKAEAEASPLQFASEIQISVNHNLITKEEFSEGARIHPTG
ncbi:hypothetical protein CDAR_553711 [Caerostris darwini]|uniref:Uncharacterized protein n=1 Tax=Caerostris darwini TaxID=1538125 RepID=A0AAV4WKY1_9ARAC|nr:hypothetical protein CDAR_553711 [Caerostris darwini]